MADWRDLEAEENLGVMPWEEGVHTRYPMPDDYYRSDLSIDERARVDVAPSSTPYAPTVNQMSSGFFSGPRPFITFLGDTATTLPETVKNAATLPHDVMTGKVDPLSDEGIGRANDLTGTVTLGGGSIPRAAPKNALRSGAPLSNRYPVNRKDKAVIVNGKLYRDDTEHVNALEEAARDAGYSSLDEAIEKDPTFENLEASAFGEIDKEGRFVPYESTEEKPLGSASYEDYLSERDNQKYWDENGDDLNANRSTSTGVAVLGNRAPVRPKLTPAIYGPDGNIYVGANHGVISQRLPDKVAKHFWDNYNPSREGFVDENGRFMTRKEALAYGRKHGLADETLSGSDELSSEDLGRAPWDRDLYTIDPDDEGIFANRDKVTGAAVVAGGERTSKKFTSQSTPLENLQVTWGPNLDDGEYRIKGRTAAAFRYKNEVFADNQHPDAWNLLAKKYPDLNEWAMVNGDISQKGIQMGEIHKGRFVPFDDNGESLWANRDKVTGATVISGGEKAPPPYSRLEREAEKLQPKASGSQYLATLKNRNIPQEEIDWTGVADWLTTQPGPVTKDALLAHIRENNVKLGEKVLGGKNIDRSPDIEEWVTNRMEELEEEGIPAQRAQERAEAEAEINFPEEVQASTRHSTHTLPGGENYREVLMTLPQRPTRVPLEEERLAFEEKMKAKYGRNHGMRIYGRMTNEERDTWNHLGFTGPVIRGNTDLHLSLLGPVGRDPDRVNFTSPHWDEPNVLAHARVNDRSITSTNSDTPQRTLFIEEIQSDWHQKGKREGYKPSNERLHQLIKEEEAIWDSEEAAGRTLENPDTGELTLSGTPPNIQSRLEEIRKLRGVMSSVPDAPFKKSWPDLILKRMVREAVENGYDQIAWTDGATQVARYKLSNQISSIEYDPRSNVLSAYPPGGNRHSTNPVIHKRVTPEELPNLIGKEAADRLVNKPTKIDNGLHLLSGLDLDIGGEGMKKFYDQELPRRANKLFGKLGGKVEDGQLPPQGPLKDGPVSEVELRNWGENPTPKIHILPITDQMRETVMGEGLPLFANKSKEAGLVPLVAEGVPEGFFLKKINRNRTDVLDSNGKVVAQGTPEFPPEEVLKGILSVENSVRSEDLKRKRKYPAAVLYKNNIYIGTDHAPVLQDVINDFPGVANKIENYGLGFKFFRMGEIRDGKFLMYDWGDFSGPDSPTLPGHFLDWKNIEDQVAIGPINVKFHRDLPVKDSQGLSLDHKDRIDPDQLKGLPFTDPDSGTILAANKSKAVGAATVGGDKEPEYRTGGGFKHGGRVNLDEITSLQRRQSDPKTVNKYRRAFKRGEDVDPILTMPRPQGGYYVLDGNHRLEGARKAGVKDIPIKDSGIRPKDHAEATQHMMRLRDSLNMASRHRAEGGGVISIKVNGTTYTGPKESFRGRKMNTNIEDRRKDQHDKVNLSGKTDKSPSALETLIAPPDDLYAPDPFDAELRSPTPIGDGPPQTVEDLILRQGGDQFTEGLVHDDTPGRTDRLPTSMPADSYVIPADIVSGMGQGNTLAGAKILDAIFRDHGTPLKKAGGGSVSRIPVIVAGGEYIVSPDKVRSIGGGDPEKGHKNMDSFVKKHRLSLVKRLKSLDGPRTD